MGLGLSSQRSTKGTAAAAAEHQGHGGGTKAASAASGRRHRSLCWDNEERGDSGEPILCGELEGWGGRVGGGHNLNACGVV